MAKEKKQLGEKKMRMFGGGSPEDMVPLNAPKPPGTIIDTRHISEGERKVLDELGIDYSQGLSANGLQQALDIAGGSLKNLIEQEKENAKKFSPPEIDPSKKPLKYDVVNITDLSREKREQVRRMLNEMTKKDIETAKKIQEEMQSNLSPTVAAGVKIMASMEEESAKQKPKPLTPSDLMPDPQAAPDYPKFSFDDDREPSGEPKPAEDPSTSTSNHAGVEPTPEKDVCARCGWEIGNPYTVKVSNQDKVEYLLAEGLGTPFVKRYKIFDGNSAVTFRSLTARETRWCMRSARIQSSKEAQGLDVKPGSVEDMLMFQAKLNDYLFAAQLLVYESSARIFEAPNSLDLWAERLDPAEPGNLLELLTETVEEECFASMSVYNAVCRVKRDFDSILNQLENNVYNKDFFDPTSN